MRVLIIQTAFTGDVILATALIEKLHEKYPEGQIDFLLRKGNEGLLEGHPLLHELLVWNKKQDKMAGLQRLLVQIRAAKYDLVVNCQRFTSTGMLTAMSGAKATAGFKQNPFSWAFTHKVAHKVADGIHETQRNQWLIEPWAGRLAALPRLYPPANALAQFELNSPYVVLAPASVWFTKALPIATWQQLALELSKQYTVYVIGGPGDKALCQQVVPAQQPSHLRSVINLAGQLSYLQSAALIKGAIMTYANDSAPLHMASAMNAPSCAIYCSTVPGFGFHGLSDHTKVVTSEEYLPCRPCGLHGHAACPKGHFKCGTTITVQQLLQALPQQLPA